MGLQLKEALQSLCCSNGWSYAVAWRLKCRDSMLLIPVGAYCEAESGMVVNQVLHQVHVVGEGIIGQVALTGKHRWIFSDTYCGEVSTIGGIADNQTVFQDTAEWSYQFSAGVKTIAVISVSSQRVIQFGSNQKIPESLEFVEHIRSSFHQLQSVLGTCLFGNSEKLIDSENYDQYGIFASLVASGNSNSNYANVLHNDICKELMVKAQCTKNLLQPSYQMTSGLYNSILQPHSLKVPIVSGSTSATKATTLMNNSSFHLMNHSQTAEADAQVIFSTPNMRQQQSTSSSANNSVLCNSSMSELSTYEFMEQQLLSGTGTQGSSNLFLTDSNVNVPLGNKYCDLQGGPFSTPSYRKNGSLNTVNHAVANIECGGKDLADGQCASRMFHVSEVKPSTSSDTYLGELKPSNAGQGLPSLNSANQLNQSSTQPLEQMNTVFTAPSNNDLFQMASSLASDVVGGDVFDRTSLNNLSSSLQDFVACSGDSHFTGSNGKQSTLNVPVQLPLDKDLFDGFGLDHRQTQGQQCWNDIIFPGCDDSSNLNTGVSECISALDSGSLTGYERGLFSDHGLEQLLDAVVGNANSVSKPNSSDQSSASTITRASSSYMHSNQVPFAGLSSLSGGMDALLPKVHSAYGPQKEALSKSLVSSWINSSNNISAESTVIQQPKKTEDHSKITRKRARPGESTRPRPKDRQQIQDRVKELREIVPNGAKCSIDALLDRTIKHMLFLQGVTKYADKLKQAIEPKMIGEASGVVSKDNSNGNGGGATLAFEVGGQTMVCPIVVEDLNPPGQMLVEMLCEERGFFLEIADVIRGFGLTILKGLMEVRDDKVWARFVVEANRDVTRLDIFMSLVKLLQQPLETSIGSSSQPNKVIDSSIPVLGNYQQSPMQLPISLADGAK